MILSICGLKVDLNWVFSLDFLFKVMKFCQFWLSSQVEVMISLDFLFKVIIFAYISWL